MGFVLCQDSMSFAGTASKQTVIPLKDHRIFTRKPRPESGRDCLTCATFARQRVGTYILLLLVEGAVVRCVPPVALVARPLGMRPSLASSPWRRRRRSPCLCSSTLDAAIASERTPHTSERAPDFLTSVSSGGRPPPHPGGNPEAHLKSISDRCYLREVAFVWGLT